MDPATSELYGEDGKYHFPGESKMVGKEIVRTSEEMVALWKNLVEKYPIIYSRRWSCRRRLGRLAASLQKK